MSIRIHYILYFLSFIIITITAWNSSGYFHADEHYQIIEAAGSKVGWNKFNDLAWEFKDEIRPSLQPWIGTLILKPLYSLGITSSDTLSFVLRWFMGLCMLGSLRFFYLRTSTFYASQSAKKPLLNWIYLFLLLFSWFIPFLSVRFSSETASAAAFLVGLALLYPNSDKKSNPIWIGLWLGISFGLRFQIAFGLVGLIIWFILFKKYKAYNFIQIVLGFVLILLLNTGLDSLFYGHVVFTPWNYFEANILHGVASSFGESGVMYYLKEGFYLPTTLVSSLVLIALVYNLIYNFRSPILWFFLSYFVGHLLIAHKEERFLFPLAFLFPYFIFSAIYHLQKKLPERSFISFLGLIPAIIHAFILVVSFPVLSLESCGLGRTKIISYIATNYSEQVTFIRPWYANPYNPWEGLPQNFYMNKNLIDVRVDNTQHFEDTLSNFHGTILVCVSESNLLIDGYESSLKKNGFIQVERSVSPLKYKLDRFTKAINKNAVLYLYEKKQ